MTNRKSRIQSDLEFSTVVENVRPQNGEQGHTDDGLAKTVSLLHATLEAIADGIVVVDLAGNTIAFNQKFLQMWKLPQALVEPKNTEERLALLADQLKNPDVFLARVQELANQPEVEGYDILELKNGHIFECYSKPQRLGDKVIGRVWNFRDVTEQKRAEVALQQRENQYRNLVETSQDLIWSVDQEGRWTFINQAAKQIYGYEPEEMLGRPFVDFETPEQIEKDMEVFARILAGESFFQYESQHIRKDGTLVELSFNAIVLRDKQGNVLGTTGTASDITQRKQADSKLKVSQELLNETQKIAKVGGWELDLETNELFWTEQVYHIHELPLDYQPNLQETLNFYAPEYVPVLQEALQKSISDGTPWDLEVEFITAKKNRIWVRAIGQAHHQNGKAVKLSGTFQDINQQKLVEATLRQNETNLAAAQRIAHLGNWISDLQTDYLYWSDEIYRIFGLAPQEFSATVNEFFSRVHPDDLDYVNKAVEEAIAHRKDYNVNHRIIRDDGEIRFVHQEGEVTFDEEDKPLQMFGIVQDITEQKRSEEALRRSEASLTAAQRIAHVGNWETNVPTNSLYWSDEIYRMFGMTPQEFSATVDGFYARVHPDDLDYVLKSVDEAIARRRSYNVDHRIVKLDGEVRFVHQEAEVTYDENGAPLRLLGVVQDVTDRKQLELKIQESLERRGRQVQLSTEIAQKIAVATDLNDLYNRVVTQVQEQFGYYYTQLLRYDPTEEVVKLVVGYGDVGAQMLAQGHYMPLEVGLIGTAAFMSKSLLRSNVTTDPDWRSNPLLPDTKGELAVPIKLGEQVLGVLDVQSNITDSLDADDQLVLEGLCGQIAIAIESTRLRQEMEDRLRELNALQNLMSHEGWQAFQSARTQSVQAYLFDQTSTRATTLDALPLEAANGLTQKQIANIATTSNSHVIARPMTIHGQTIGILGVQDNPDNLLSPEDQAFLDTVAEQVAEALERARLLEQMQKRAIEMETVAQVSSVASTILDTDKLLQDVANLTKDRFGLYHAHIYLLDEGGDTLKLAAGAGEVGRRMVMQGWSISLQHEHSLVARAARTRQTVVVGDVRQNPDFMPNPALPQTHSEMAIPLMMGDIVLGVLDVQSDIINRFTDEDIRVQSTLAAQVAVALRNANLYQQTQLALTDIKQSQELLRATIDATPDWIFIKDRNHRYQLVNQGYANSLGTSVEEIIGKNDLELGFPEEFVKGDPAKGLRGFWADDSEVMNSGQSKFIDVEPAFVKGQPVFLSTTKVPLRDSGGNVWGVLGFVHDITQREHLLAEAENLYNASRRINEATSLQEITAAIVEEVAVPVINRAVLVMFEHDALGGVDTMVVTANWYSGKGTLPTSVGIQYPKAAFAALGLLFTTIPLFFDDIQHDERIDLATSTLLQQLNIQSMAVLPIWVGSHQLGSLLLETEEAYKFTERDVRFNRSLISQAGVAIDNLRLLNETRTALAEVERTQRRYTLQTWETYRNQLTTLSYEHVREGVTPLGDNLLPEISRMIVDQPQLIPSASLDIAEDNRPSIIVDDLLTNNNQLIEPNSSLIVPLKVRGEVIGILGLQELDEQRKWLPEEIALIEAISEQLAQAAENIRLVEETQQQAAREKRVNEIGEKIQAAQSLEEALKVAVKEVGLSLHASQTVVQLEAK